jgi:Autoinducer binding domain
VHVAFGVRNPMGARRKSDDGTASGVSDGAMLLEAASIIEKTHDLEETIRRLRDLLNVEHVVYHSSKLGASPSADPFIRLTYPASWIKRYLQMGYVDVDPVIRVNASLKLPAARQL